MIAVRVMTYRGMGSDNQLLYTLKSIQDSWKDFSKADIKVVEDPSGHYQGHAKKIADDFHVEYLSLPKWGGMAACANFAMDSAPPDSYVMLVQDDSLVTSDNLAQARDWEELLKDYPVAGFQQPRIDLQDIGITREHFYYDYDKWYSPDMRCKNEYFLRCDIIHGWSGPGTVIKRSAWKQLGGFHPWYQGFEEFLAARVYLSSDMFICKAPSSPHIHLGGGAQAATDHYEGAKKGWTHPWANSPDIKEQFDINLGSACRKWNDILARDEKIQQYVNNFRGIK